MPWSAEQERAINTYDKNILVAAAAGSGKTSVLVERIIQRIVHGTCDINEILVVTFTNAAAAEMRERIAAAITEKLSDAAKERQLVLLNAASISTLHAFCQNIIRQNFHQIDLDPKFRLANQQEIDLLKLDVLDELFEQKYDAENNLDFLQFTDTYGSERGDEGIYDIILKLYEYSRSQPFPEHWLKSLPDYFAVNSEAEFLTDCAWFKLLQEEVQNELQSAATTAEQMLQQAVNLHLDYYVQIAQEDIAELTDLSAAAKQSWGNVETAINSLKFKQLRPPKNTPEDIKTQFKELRDEVKQIIKGLKENYFEQPLDDVLSDMPLLQQQAAVLCNLTLDFAESFAQAKAEKSILDFSDLEHFALQILAKPESTPDNLIATDTAIAFQEKYKEIMVDEYQDTNGVQEAILNLIRSSHTPNLFVVGDVKQSIYKFRLAEPELFLAKYTNYPMQNDCERIDLAKNFRSRKEILDGVNFIFAQVMTEKAAELPYGEAEALRCGMEYPHNDNAAPTLKSPIELAIFSKEAIVQNDKTNNKYSDAEPSDSENAQGFNAESLYIAQRLKELMAQSPVVFDKHLKAYRPLKWRDIVILLRSVQNKAMLLAETLRQADIPVYASVESGYFQETEVRIMVSLLQIIDNPQQDIPLTAVLYSPIIGLTAEDLARIRLLSPAGGMYQALKIAVSEDSRLKQALKHKLNGFLTDLARWRNYARRHSVPELIWLLFNETGYYDYVGGMREGLVRQANLRALYDRAASYEQTSFRGLFRFLRFIHKLQSMGNDLAVARSLGESEDVVRIMSIHKSKGLEFPVVIIADAGKQFNLTDTRNPVLFHKKLGLGLYVNDLEHSIRYQTLSRQAIAQQITRENKAEELRVLYVAMTRAREKLIITGSVKNLHKFAKSCCVQVDTAEQTLPPHTVLKAKSYLDWLGLALARHRDGGLLRQYGDAAKAQLLTDESTWQLSLIDSQEAVADAVKKQDNAELLKAIKQLKVLPPTENETWVKERLHWQYPHKEALYIPAKLSVTEIKRRFAEQLQQEELNAENVFDNLDSNKSIQQELAFKRPQFLQQQTSMTSVEYGSLWHTVMQHLNFHGDITDDGIKAQLQNMAANEIIAREHINKIYRKNIRDFLYSDIGMRLRKAKSLARELPFNRVLAIKDLPVQNIYPAAAANDTIFIQGIIDVLFEEDDGLVLLDYKTDNCDAKTAKERYTIQLELYANAAAEIMYKPIKEKYLYLFHRAQFVKL